MIYMRRIVSRIAEQSSLAIPLNRVILVALSLER